MGGTRKFSITKKLSLGGEAPHQAPSEKKLPPATPPGLQFRTFAEECRKLTFSDRYTIDKQGKIGYNNTGAVLEIFNSANAPIEPDPGVIFTGIPEFQGGNTYGN